MHRGRGWTEQDSGCAPGALMLRRILVMSDSVFIGIALCAMACRRTIGRVACSVLHATTRPFLEYTTVRTLPNPSLLFHSLQGSQTSKKLISPASLSLIHSLSPSFFPLSLSLSRSLLAHFAEGLGRSTTALTVSNHEALLLSVRAGAARPGPILTVNGPRTATISRAKRWPSDTVSAATRSRCVARG